MHRLFRKALNNASGQSKPIIAVIIDIRDFSGFSQRCESVDVAAFIRKVYMKIIDEYFSFASFYKSTGDGLLLTIPWTEKNLQQVSQEVIASCIACHSQFAEICSGDPSINFEVPDKIGIGIARGSSCRLVSGNRTIDYSGRLLNLTARLTDISRPSGIVVDGAFIIDLLTEEQRSMFEEDKVYLKGIAEAEPIRVYFTPEFTVIPKYNKQPIASERWREQVDSKPFRDILKFNRFRYDLESEPLSADDIKVVITHDKIMNGEVIPGYVTVFNFYEFEYRLDRGKPLVVVDFQKLCKRLKRKQIKEDMDITISVAYVEK